MIRRVGQFALVALLPTIVGLWLVGRPLQEGTLVLWNAATEDLAVYREAAIYLLQGRDYYHLENSFPFIYPPIAAVLAVPLAVIPWWAAQVVWTLLNVALVVMVLRHLRVRPAWVVSLAATAAILFMGPLAGTLNFGQLGIVLMAMVVLDVMDGPHLLTRGSKRVVPAGVLTGLATGLKLTPAVFIIYFFLSGRKKAGFVSLGTFLATILIGLAASPQYSIGYWLRLAGGDSGANPDAHGWIGNMSVMSSIYRFTDVTTIGTLLGLAASGLLVLIGLVVAWQGHRANKELLGVAILGMVSCFANPIAWVHHLTWVLPLLVAGVRDRIPPVLRWSLLITVLWNITQPQLTLRGAPWAQAEIHEYSVIEKIFAAGPALVLIVLVIVALVSLRKAPAEVAKNSPKRAVHESIGDV